MSTHKYPCRVTLDLTESDRAKLQALAEERGATLAGVIRVAIRDYLARCESPTPRPAG